ncbi:2TM domain-containing protein [Maribacter sp.]|uniref:2TM domain-containing protein n=1 Tax=Maribacter sp. TaxID=1897614 RepID=UPI003C7289AA
METKRNEFEKYEKAKNRIENIKRLYAHVVLFFIATILLFVFKGRLIDFLVSKGITDEGFLHWVALNTILLPVIWAIVLIFVGIYLLRYKPGFIKNWENRKLNEFLDE